MTAFIVTLGLLLAGAVAWLAAHQAPREPVQATATESMPPVVEITLAPAVPVTVSSPLPLIRFSKLVKASPE